MTGEKIADRLTAELGRKVRFTEEDYGALSNFYFLTGVTIETDRLGFEYEKIRERVKKILDAESGGCA